MKKNISTYLKVIVWTYIVPGIILVYITITLKFDVKQMVAFISVYLVIATAFNVFLAKLHKNDQNTASRNTSATTTEQSVSTLTALVVKCNLKSLEKSYSYFSSL